MRVTYANKNEREYSLQQKKKYTILIFLLRFRVLPD